MVFDLTRFQNFYYLKAVWVRNVIIFGVDISSSLHIDNKKKDILILGIDPMQGLDDNTLTIEAKYSINFQDPLKKLFLSLHFTR